MKDMLNVSSSPHIRHSETVTGIMGDVIIALMPAAVYGCILFGIRAAAVLAVCVLTAVLSEFLWDKALKKPNSAKDLSAVVTGLLLGMNLPPTLPLWQAAIGSVFAIIVVKQMFGGLGHNFANPAITARISPAIPWDWTLRAASSARILSGRRWITRCTADFPTFCWSDTRAS